MGPRTGSIFDDPPALPLIFQSLKPVLEDEMDGTRAAPRMPLGFSTLVKLRISSGPMDVEYMSIID
jgi:hypothetical protein